MKNKILILIALSLSASCSRHYSLGKLGEISKIEKDFMSINGKNQKPGRLIAQSAPEACATDEPTEERLVQEIKVLENNNQVVGSKTIINGLDLSRFPPSQSLYLEKNKEWIYTTDLDLRECADIKCVFSKIYPNSTGIEGYISYYFYLKMGYALSTVNDLTQMGYPDFASVKGTPEKTLTPATPYTEVLFSKKELINFYYLSKALGPSFQKMPSLSSIHRVPNNMYWKKADYACGFASGYPNKGFVVLMDKCLIKDPNATTEDFFPLVTHEFSHRIDYDILPKNALFSESPTWLEFSGWYIKEDVDANGKPIRIWTSGATNSNPALVNDGFIRNYAATSPGEDFADSIGFARFTPDEVQKSSPRKYAWITNNLFNGKSYTAAGLTNAYVTSLTNSSMKDLPSIINNCVDNKGSYTYTLSQNDIENYKEYDPQLIQCIFGGVNQYLADYIRYIKSEEYGACNYFKSNEGAIKIKVLGLVNDFVKSDLNKNIEVAKQLKIVSEFITKLNDQIDSREIFIACQEDKDPIECYNKQLQNVFDLAALDYQSQIPNQLLSLKQSFDQENRYSVVKEKLVNLFGQIFMGSDLKLKAEAKRKWGICFESENPPVTNSTDEVLLSPFNGGTQFIKKSLLNCINNGAQTETMAILDKVSSKLSITISNASIKKFIFDMYISNYTSALQSFVEREAANEDYKINQIKDGITKKVVTTLSSNTSWLGSLPQSNEQNAKLCLDESKKIISNEMINSPIKEDGYNFHASVTDLWKDQICGSILSSSAVKTVIEANQTNAVKKVLPKLDALLLITAEDSMKKCKAQFSKATTLVLASRNFCLTNPVSWGDVEDNTVSNWLTNEKIGFISSAKRKGEDYLESKRANLKAQAIKKMNAK